MRLIYILIFALSLLLAGAAAQKWGAAELRSNFSEVAVVPLIAIPWLIAATVLFSWFGLSLRDYVVERKNIAALVALSGGLAGVAFTYIGGNLGEGPSFWNNFYSAGLATMSFFGLWLVLEVASNVSISIAEEKDLASGVRLCGLLLALGLVLGRAVAGDWHSTEATFHDFARDGWPAAVLCVLAIPVEWIVRPSRRQPFPSWLSAGLLPAVGYLLLAAGWLWRVGRWEGMVR